MELGNIKVQRVYFQEPVETKTDERLQNRDKVVRHTYNLENVIIFSPSHFCTSLLAQPWDKATSSAPVWRQIVEPALGTTGTSGLYNIHTHYSPC